MTRLQFVRQGILNDNRPFAVSLAWSVTGVAAAVLLRQMLAPALHGVPFVTFFPAVLVISIILGWRWALAVAVVSAALANFLFIDPPFGWALGSSGLIATGAFLVTAILTLITGATLRQTVREIDASNRLAEHLNTELQHRVKNNLAVVQGLARQTARSATLPDDFYAAFSGRLAALAEAHNLLASGNWQGSQLPELPRAALRPFNDHKAITFDGPPCVVPAASCVPLVLGLHELGTNAIKYGALSVNTGRVEVRWRLEGDDLLIEWQEAGGPPVTPPSRRGLGSRLLSRQAGLSSVVTDYRPEGVRCQFTVESARLV